MNLDQIIKEAVKEELGEKKVEAVDIADFCDELERTINRMDEVKHVETSVEHNCVTLGVSTDSGDAFLVEVTQIVYGED